MSARLGPFPVEYMGNWVNGAGMGGLIPSLMNVAILGTQANFQTSGFIWYIIKQCFSDQIEFTTED
jgi:hypothetical protein